MAKNLKKTNEHLDYSQSMVKLIDEWPQQSFFAISLLRDGSTKRTESEDYTIFKPLVDKAEITWINCCVENLNKDVIPITAFFGFQEQIVKDLLREKISSYKDLGTEMGLLVPAVKIRELTVHVSKIIILVKKNLVLVVQNKKVTRFMRFMNYSEAFMKKIPMQLSSADKVTILLARLLDKTNEKNFENLRLIEDEGEKTSKLLIDSNLPRKDIGLHIYSMKRALINYLGALWASLDVINSLRYGDSDLISDDKILLGELTLLANEIKTHISLSEHMSEVLASGLEVMQSIYNNQLQILNNRLSLVITWLTVVGTAFLVPNTIATIMSISSISEHLDEPTAIGILAASTILAALGSYWFIKKIMPRQVE